MNCSQDMREVDVSQVKYVLCASESKGGGAIHIRVMKITGGIFSAGQSR